MKRAFIIAMLICLLSAAALSEVYTGVSTGFGGDVEVSIEVESGSITDCVIKSDGETPSVGGTAAITLVDEIVKHNGVIDAVTGATTTSNAVKAALGQAMSKAGIATQESSVMKPGVYTGSAHGFSCIDEISVKATVSENTITDLELEDTFLKDMDSYENPYMAKGAFALLSERILVSQSIGVDSVTGATGSSAGIKNAVRKALVEAYKAAGSTEEQAEDTINMNFLSASIMTPSEKQLECDVVVIGAGASGAIASVTALDAGADVINVEKTFRWGGQSMLTGGPKVFSPDTSEETLVATIKEYDGVVEQSRFGKDAVWNDEEYRASHASEYQDFNRDAYKAVIPASGSGAIKLMEGGVKFSQGIDFSKLAGGPEMPKGGMPAMSQATMIDEADIKGCAGSNNINYVDAEAGYESFYSEFLRKGGRALLNTSATGLIYDDEGNVTGVMAECEDGTIYTIYAKSVVLATGGFGANEEMLDEYTPGGSGWIYYGWQNNVGDGINMALDAGAATTNMDAYPMSHQRMGAEFITCFDVQTTPQGEPWSPNDISVVLAVNPDGVYITKDGDPFKTEDIHSQLGGFSSSMGSYYLGAKYYVAYSASQLRQYACEGIDNTGMGFQNVGLGVPAGYPLGDWIYTILDYAESRGWAWKVESLSEGDKILGLPAGSLEAAYSLDQTTLNGDSDDYYYILTGTGLSISSCGGILVDDGMRAVKPDGSVIANLFVAGNDSFGNIMATGAEYSIGGDAGMWCFGSGYIAGTKAAE